MLYSSPGSSKGIVRNPLEGGYGTELYPVRVRKEIRYRGR